MKIYSLICLILLLSFAGCFSRNNQGPGSTGRANMIPANQETANAGNSTKTVAPNRVLKLLEKREQASKQDFRYFVTGRVQNISSGNLNFSVAVVTFSDNAGKTIVTHRSYLDLANSFKPGEVSWFTVGFDMKTNEMVKYKITFEDKDGQALDFIDVSSNGVDR